MFLRLALTIAILCLPVHAVAATYYVATTGNDAAAGSLAAPWQTISHAAETLQPGDTALVRGGVYSEAVTISVSGTASQPITIQNYPGETPILDGTELTVPDDDNGLFLIQDQHYLTIAGFKLRNYTSSTRWRTPVGIRIMSGASHITIQDCVLTNIGSTASVNSSKNGRDAHGILVSGDSTTPTSDITITGCTLRKLTLGSSEALAVNGNVDTFTIENNTLYNLDNIGIDAIGYEDTCSDESLDYARNGTIRNNTVYNVTSWGNPAYGKEWAAGGIYVDGGADILIEANTVYTCDLGVEIASEHKGKATTRVTVRNNLLYANRIAGLAMGGYDTKRGATTDCVVINNTFFNNDTEQDGNGELLLQYNVSGNTIRNNIFYAGSEGLLIGNNFTLNEDNTLDYNLYYTSGWMEWQWKKQYYDTFSAYKSASGQDSHSIYAAPRFVSTTTPDAHLTANSPAIDAGQTTSDSGTTDLDGANRTQGTATDLGAYEYEQTARQTISPGVLLLLQND